MDLQSVFTKIVIVSKNLPLIDSELVYAHDISLKAKLVSDKFSGLETSERFEMIDKLIGAKHPEILTQFSVSYELLTPEEDVSWNGKDALSGSKAYLQNSNRQVAKEIEN